MSPWRQSHLWLRTIDLKLLYFFNEHFYKVYLILRIVMQIVLYELRRTKLSISTCALLISMSLLSFLIEIFKRNFLFEREKPKSWKYREVEKPSFSKYSVAKKESISDFFGGYSSLPLDSMHKICRKYYWLNFHLAILLKSKYKL